MVTTYGCTAPSWYYFYGNTVRVNRHSVPMLGPCMNKRCDYKYIPGKECRHRSLKKKYESATVHFRILIYGVLIDER
jgi:hypothetical protein